MSELTLKDLMARMPGAFLPEKATGVDVVIQYHLTGDEASDWVIRIQDGQCRVEEGMAADPTLTLTADSQDYKDVVTGKQNAMQAFMQGKLKLAGDLNLAMKLTSFFQLN